MVLIKRGVNYIPDRGNIHDETYEEMLAKSCEYCSIKMIFREEIDNYFCCYCGWQPLKNEEKVKADKQEGDDN
jgi:hypothetical protein